MPAIIALFLRQVIMSVATGAVVTGAQEYLNGTIKELVFEIKDKQKITEKDAWDVVNNILSDLAVNSAAILLTLKTKVAVGVAEFLGLTSKGLVKKTLSKTAAAAAAKLAADGGKVAATNVFKKIATIAAVPASGIWLASALANIIEPGIYKPEQTNALYKKLGIPFQYPVTGGALKPGSFTTESFRDYAKGLETVGVVGIIDPFKAQTVIYSRENLASLIDYVYGKEVQNGNAPSANKLIPLLAQYIIKTGGTSSSASGTPSTGGTGTTISTPKVFTGIVSQGVVGKGLVFTPRPDDLIESIAELREAASNNLAPFLNTLLGKIVYEVKIVSSVISKDGFRQTGTTQRVKTGTYANGTPKYKTVTNKFATLVVYALTDKGSRAKLTTIVLGPTNSAKLTIIQDDLQELQNELPKLVTTNDINEITGIETVAPVEVTTPGAETGIDTEGEKREYWVKWKAFDGEFKIGPFTNRKAADFAEGQMETEYREIKKRVSSWAIVTEEPNLPEWKGIEKENATISTPVPVTVPVVNQIGSNAAKLGANAKTLYEWYQAQGQTLPSVSARSKIYEGLGLGPASYYTGTAEQNTRLLNALKGAPNATTSSAQNYSGYIDNGALGVR